MEQKEINERIAMAMLKVCALVWEYLTTNPNKGGFKFSEVLNAIDRGGERSKLGHLDVNIFDPYIDNHINTGFLMAVSKIAEVKNCDERYGDMTISVPTDERTGTSFECNFLLGNGVFNVCDAFCKCNDCSSLLNKTKFFYNTEGRWTLLPGMTDDEAKTRIVKTETEEDTRDVLATIRFSVDKVLPKMKKCLDTDDIRPVMEHPAIETSTGVMVASDGHILAVHKLQGYSFHKDDKAVLDNVLILPAEVLQMKGMVTVTVQREDNKNVIVAEDEQGNAGRYEDYYRYPNWRGALPDKTGVPVKIDAKALDKAVKQIARTKDAVVRIAAEPTDKALIVSRENAEGTSKLMTSVSMEPMPYKVVASFFGRMMRVMLTLAPTAMRFVDSVCGLLFTNDDTIVLLMPLLCDEKSCSVDPRELVEFSVDKWIAGERQTAKVVKAVKAEPVKEVTMADRLRAALLAMQEQAA